MALTPGEHDRLLLHLQALLARERRDRGLALNVPEATALIADAVCEWARDGLDLTTARDRAARLLGPDDVLPGVTEAVTEVRVEARFSDGTRLVVVRDPFGVHAPGSEPEESPEAQGSIEIGNEADTPIGLTSHVHLAEVNPRLRLDRTAAYGMRLAISTGDTVWVRPGEVVTLPMRAISGTRVQVGTSGVVDGPLDDPEVRSRALRTLRACGYLDVDGGVPVGDVQSAEGAITRLMRDRVATSGEERRP